MFTLESTELEMQNEIQKGWQGKGKKSMEGERERDCACYVSWCFCILPTNFPTYLINVNCQYMTIHR